MAHLSTSMPTAILTFKLEKQWIFGRGGIRIKWKRKQTHPETEPTNPHNNIYKTILQCKYLKWLSGMKGFPLQIQLVRKWSIFPLHRIPFNRLLMSSTAAPPCRNPAIQCSADAPPVLVEPPTMGASVPGIQPRAYPIICIISSHHRLLARNTIQGLPILGNPRPLDDETGAKQDDGWRHSGRLENSSR